MYPHGREKVWWKHVSMRRGIGSTKTGRRSNRSIRRVKKEISRASFEEEGRENNHTIEGSLEEKTATLGLVIRGSRPCSRNEKKRKEKKCSHTIEGSTKPLRKMEEEVATPRK